MKRNLEAMAATTHDVVVIGGGVTGACVARDAAMRGLRVALIEGKDFAHATSAASSKLIHGGLRYLKNLEFGLIRESLAERRIWEITAPHMVYPLAFLMPTYGHGFQGRWITHLGLTAYDWLSYDRNNLDDEDKKIPAHRNLRVAEALSKEPGLNPKRLTGAMLYYDCQMHAPERLALECIQAAAEHDAHIANYAEVKSFKFGVSPGGKSVTGVEVVDTLNGLCHTVRGHVFVNATGPWADIMLGHVQSGKPTRRLIRSKGIHLITRKLTAGTHAVACQTKGGHFFVLPWRGHSIIGTTDTLYKGDVDNVGVTEQDIEEFLAVINEGFPAAQLKRADVLHAYAGLRPLVDTSPQSDNDDSDSYNASRKSEIFDHKEEDLNGFISAIGGKWTTSRKLAEQVVDLAEKKLSRHVQPTQTHTTPLPGGELGRYSTFEKRMVSEYAEFDDEVIENLARNYGSMIHKVIDLCRENPKLKQRLSPRLPDICAQVVYAVRNEMAQTVDDVMFRRTGLGTLGHPGGDAVAKIARLMNEELGWDAAETVRQTETAESRFLGPTFEEAIS